MANTFEVIVIGGRIMGVEWMQSIDIRVELFNGQTLREITPYLRSDDVGVAVEFLEEFA